MEERSKDILMLLQLMFVLLIIIFGVYAKVVGNYDLVPLIIIFVSGMLFITGLQGYNRTGRLSWRFLSLVSLVMFLSVIVDVMLIS